MSTPALRRPLVPEDIVRGDPMRCFWRATTAVALATQNNASAEQLAQRHWKDERAAFLTRAASTPASTGTATWAGNLSLPTVGDLIADLAPLSAAARLFQACLRVDLGGVGSVSVPVPTTNPAPVFIAEGAAIPVGNSAYVGSVVGPTKKLAIIESFSEELGAASNAEQIIRKTMRRAAARQLDAVVFDSVAADTTRPAGLLNSAPVIAPVAGGGLTALTGDIKAAVDAIVTAGGGASLMFFASPSRVIIMHALLGGADIGFAIVPLATAPAASLIVLDVGGIASAFDGLPEIESGREMVLHMEGTTPLAIGTPPATLATPAYSHFQTDLVGLRLRLKCAWAKLAVANVQHVPNCTW